MECSICYNNILDINKVITECNHVFHFSCLLKNFKSNPSTGEQCPLCRKSFLESSPINNSNTYVPPSNASAIVQFLRERFLQRSPTSTRRPCQSLRFCNDPRKFGHIIK